MKRLIVILSFALTASPALAFNIFGVGFYAPAVPTSTVVQPETGAIVLDSGTFYGNTVRHPRLPGPR